MVQLAPAATELPQLLVWAKSPSAARLVIVSVASPVFCSVTVCGELVEPSSVEAKERLAGLRLTSGTTAPVPLKATVCGVEESDALIVSVPVIGPVTVGAKAILTGQA